MNKLKLNVFWYELFFFTLINILSLSIIGYLIKMFKNDARLLNTTEFKQINEPDVW